MKELQIKTTMRYHLTSTSWLKSKSQIVASAGKDVEKLEACWWECNMVQSIQKIVSQFLKPLNTKLQRDPAILLLGICPGEMTTYVPEKLVHKCPGSIIHCCQKV